MQHAAASRYARAFADAVLDPKSGLEPPRAWQELRAFGDIIRGSSELRNVLLSPAVSAARKRAVVGRLAATLPISKLVRNFLFVLIDRRRIGMLDDVIEAFETEIDSRLGIVRAQVTSAAALDEPQRVEMQTALARVAGKQVRARFDVDPALIGGAVVRIGSTIYDGSVRGQLDSLRDRLVS
ncbi:MAG TPA: ATP synthase F1 subunit delta, partial [Bryobacteraceae bacterium]|nr:ATP synthase F1 subunit delta [Bryobacteraceae bacterium]